MNDDKNDSKENEEKPILIQWKNMRGSKNE